MGRRIRLAYSVEEEDVLGEIASLVGLAGQQLQKSADLFGAVQEELRLQSTLEDGGSLETCFELINNFRIALYNIDTRLSDMTEILVGYNQLSQVEEGYPEPLPLEESSEDSPESDE